MDSAAQVIGNAVVRSDQAATLFVNSLHSPFSDSVWKFFSEVEVWIPLYALILFFWFASPVSSHLLAGMEVEISDRLKDNCDVEETERKGGVQ